MKITKFAQSAILIKTKNKRILIDPGYIDYKEEYLTKQWSNIDVVLITHRHSDHCHMDYLKEIQKTAKVYTNSDVLELYTELKAEIVKEGDVIELDDIQIEVVKAVHGYMPFLQGDKKIKENTGFIIDDQKKRLYHVSDSVCFENTYSCDILCVPVCNHGLVMGPFEAAHFAKATKAKLVIPIHYDNDSYPVDINKIQEEFEKMELNYKVLDIEESIVV